MVLRQLRITLGHIWTAKSFLTEFAREILPDRIDCRPSYQKSWGQVFTLLECESRSTRYPTARHTSQPRKRISRLINCDPLIWSLRYVLSFEGLASIKGKPWWRRHEQRRAQLARSQKARRRHSSGEVNYHRRFPHAHDQINRVSDYSPGDRAFASAWSRNRTCLSVEFCARVPRVHEHRRVDVPGTVSNDWWVHVQRFWLQESKFGRRLGM